MHKEENILLKKQHFINKVMQSIFLISGSVTVLIVVGMLVFLLKESIPVFADVKISAFWASATWNPTGWKGEEYGVWGLLWGTIFVTLTTLALSVPLGILTAVFMAEMAPPGLHRIVKPAVELLAGIPSVVIGFFGLVFVAPMIAKVFHLSNGLSVLNGSLMLTIMVLPTIISLSEDAISMVPQDYRLASLSLGASKLETIFKVVLPAASSGITAAIMLGMGRAIGETMAVLMACGNAPALATTLFSPVRTLTSTIAIEMGEVAYDTSAYYALFNLGLYLFLISFIINNVAEYFFRKRIYE